MQKLKVSSHCTVPFQLEWLAPITQDTNLYGTVGGKTRPNGRWDLMDIGWPQAER